MQLTDANYYSLEADRAYMSFHQLKNWRECPAREHARQAGRWVEEPATALVVGQYVHTALLEPEKLEAWLREQGPSICTKGGQLRAEFRQAGEMVARLKRDTDAMVLLQGPGGESEAIVTCELEGVLWKAKMDRLYRHLRMVVDLKTARDFEDDWAAGRKAKVQWWRLYDYDAQMALYCRMLSKACGGEWCNVLVGVSKQDPPDLAGVEIADQLTLSMGYSAAVAGLQEAMAYKRGELPPPRCERCEFCRATKRLTIVKV